MERNLKKLNGETESLTPFVKSLLGVSVHMLQQEVGQGMQVSVCVCLRESQVKALFLGLWLCLCESQVKALFLGLWPITMVDGKIFFFFYTVRTDTETESEILMYRRLFTFCNYSSFTWWPMLRPFCIVRTVVWHDHLVVRAHFCQPRKAHIVLRMNSDSSITISNCSLNLVWLVGCSSCRV